MGAVDDPATQDEAPKIGPQAMFLTKWWALASVVLLLPTVGGWALLVITLAGDDPPKNG